MNQNVALVKMGSENQIKNAKLSQHISIKYFSLRTIFLVIMQTYLR